LIPRTKAVIDMPGQDDKRRLKLDLTIAGALFAAGVVVSVMSLAQIRAESRMELAQATPPLQGTPSDDQNKTPAESKPGGDRPTTPAPEPARPDPQTQGAATQPALPPAPAEKVAPPIKEK
jgi:type IV secretory pathway VirB10-like protein